MKMQETDSAGQQVTPSLPVRPKRNRWLAGVGAIIVVIVLVGLCSLVFAQLKQHQDAQTLPTPPAGQWKQVLKGYTYTSLVAAPGDPAIVYACAIRETPGGTSQSNTNPITILRSADFGDHWQDIGKSDIASGACQIAVNGANGNDIYVVSYGHAMPNPVQLKHSQDGGKTWETILPVMHDSSLQTPIQWSIQQMWVEGNHLFGTQMIVPRALPAGPTIKSVPYLAPRLATSVDGGHTWVIIDNQFASQRLGVSGYTVDPDNLNTIYELIGASLLPVNLRSLPTYDPLPIFGMNQELFKTTDGGATWQSVLKNIPYASQVQLALSNPQLLYVGGSIGPLPLLPDQPGQSYPSAIGAFHLQMSTNGGSSWQNVTIPSDMQSIQNWFVSPMGQVYASPTITSSLQPTVIPGTVQPATPAPVQTVNPQSSVPSKPVGADLSSPALIYQPSTFDMNQIPDASLATSQFIRRYNPDSNSWSNVTRPPTTGFMLQLTSAQSSNGAVLWFVGIGNDGQTLYRYIV